MVKIFQLALLAGSVAPSIAAGGTVFATAAKRKGEHDQIWLASKTNLIIICHLLVNTFDKLSLQ